MFLTDLIEESNLLTIDSDYVDLIEKLEDVIALLTNLNNWLEVLVVGLIVVLLIYLFYKVLINFI